MEFKNTKVFNMDGAIRGMRNPWESWYKSDSYVEKHYDNKAYEIKEKFIAGEADLDLMKSLVKGGPSHRKFMRQIFICVDITAPLYWWKEFDTYKVGTTSNSTSTMHKIASKPITKDCFELDGDDNFYLKDMFDVMVGMCEELRQNYLTTKDKVYWKALIQLLPCSWLQTRTITMSYENVYNMVQQRKNHKLTEWSEDFINWTKSLPYGTELFSNGLKG